jgi:hypothetical protein
MYQFYPSLAQVALADINVAAGGTEDNPDGEEPQQTENGESEIGGGEEGPGCHVSFVSTVFTIA